MMFLFQEIAPIEIPSFLSLKSFDPLPITSFRDECFPCIQLLCLVVLLTGRVDEAVEAGVEVDLHFHHVIVALGLHP